MEYIVLSANRRSRLDGNWNSAFWSNVPSLEIARFRPESSGHHPQTAVKLTYNQDGLCGLFRVEDNYVLCTHTRFMDPVYTDSCVEFFVQPRPDSGYFNFEFNCGGALLASYIVDPTRTANGFKDFTLLRPEDAEHIDIYHSMPAVVEPEIEEETLWHLEFFIPFSVLEAYAGTVKAAAGDTWRANFYKCGDKTSHPHWGAWSEVDELNFHLPCCFGTLRFGPF